MSRSNPLEGLPQHKVDEFCRQTRAAMQRMMQDPALAARIRARAAKIREEEANGKM